MGKGKMKEVVAPKESAESETKAQKKDISRYAGLPTNLFR